MRVPSEPTSVPSRQPRTPAKSPQGWFSKFRLAFSGIYWGIRGQRSFLVHLPLAALVIACGVVFRVSLLEWCLLTLCMAAVIAAELFNSALEMLATAIDRRYNPRIGRALDIASGAVLVMSLGAAAVGAAIFLYRAVLWLGFVVANNA